MLARTCVSALLLIGSGGAIAQATLRVAISGADLPALPLPLSVNAAPIEQLLQLPGRPLQVNLYLLGANDPALRIPPISPLLPLPAIDAVRPGS